MSVREVSLVANSIKFDSAVDKAFAELQELQAEQDQVRKETEKVAEKVKADTKESKSTMLATLTAARKMSALVAFAASQSGDAIAQALSIAFNATILTAEALVEIAAAESLTIVGALAAGLKLTAAAGLFVTAGRIAQARDDSSELDSAVQGLILLGAAL